MMVGLLVGTLVGVGTVAGLAAPASAGPLPYTVYVGYGDNVHATASFPVPWYGDSGVIWEGCSGGCPNDVSGAVRVVNTGDASGLTVDSVSVNVGGCTFSAHNVLGDRPVPRVRGERHLHPDHGRLG